jgi:hypothetical protein
MLFDGIIASVVLEETVRLMDVVSVEPSEAPVVALIIVYRVAYG